MYSNLLKMSVTSFFIPNFVRKEGKERKSG